MLVRDLSGKLLAWIEIGAPDAARFTRAARRPSARPVYTHRDPANCWRSGRARDPSRRRDRAAQFRPEFIDSVVDEIDRRNTVTFTVTERQLYLELNGVHLSSAVHDHPIR